MLKSQRDCQSTSRRLTLFPLGRDTFITVIVYHVTRPRVNWNGNCSKPISIHWVDAYLQVLDSKKSFCVIIITGVRPEDERAIVSESSLTLGCALLIILCGFAVVLKIVYFYFNVYPLLPQTCVLCMHWLTNSKPHLQIQKTLKLFKQNPMNSWRFGKLGLQIWILLLNILLYSLWKL